MTKASHISFIPSLHTNFLSSRFLVKNRSTVKPLGQSRRFGCKQTHAPTKGKKRRAMNLWFINVGIAGVGALLCGVWSVMVRREGAGPAVVGEEREVAYELGLGDKFYVLGSPWAHTLFMDASYCKPHSQIRSQVCLLSLMLIIFVWCRLACSVLVVSAVNYWCVGI